MKAGHETPKWNWPSEAALCKAFEALIPKQWISYNETGGFDMLLVHKNGMQIGVEAKLTLNAKVLVQATENMRRVAGPDYRAVLVGRVIAENAVIASRLGLTVITLDVKWSGPRRGFLHQGPPRPQFALGWNCRLPEFPLAGYDAKAGRWQDRENWHDFCPETRLALPEYLPDVGAGHSAPQTLSDWKIKAIKICVWVEINQRINRSVFRSLKIDPGRWMDGYWLQKGNQRGWWVAGNAFPASRLRKQHPEVYAQVEADFPVWSKSISEVSG